MNRKLLCILLVLTLMVSAAGCMHKGPEPTDGPDVPVVADPTDAPAVSTDPAGEPQPQEETTDPGPREWTWDIHSGMREDGSFNEGTIFVGDSLTFGLVSQFLKNYELIGDAKYLAIVGVPVGIFNTRITLGGDPEQDYVCSPEFKGKTYFQAIDSVGEQATAIYMMMGTNFDFHADSQTYVDIVNHMLETCPNATVYMQTIPYSWKSAVRYEVVNKQIHEAYDHFAKDGIERVQLIDTFNTIDAEGLGKDGIHLNGTGLDAWYNTIAGFMGQNNIPE